MLSFRRLYGGNVYELALAQALAGHALQRFNVYRPWGGGGWLSVFGWLRELARCELLVGNATTHLLTWPLFWLRRCVIVHHVDWRGSPRLSCWLQQAEWWVLRHLTPRRTPIVVVSQVWVRQLRRQGFTRVRVIHNAFEPADYAVTDAEVQAFRQRHGLVGQRLVYVGNGLRRKGCDQVAAAFAGAPVQLVASGVQSDLGATPGVRLMPLPWRDYLCLLKASECAVLLSQFREGWNRTAHECVLMGTPVLGAARGGMRELLMLTGQPIVATAQEARRRLDAAAPSPVSPGQRRAAEAFHPARFAAAWQALIDELTTGRR